ncbi:MAG: hypothetical protein SGBAC_000691 [Bacillariaceae sp.]
MNRLGRLLIVLSFSFECLSFQPQLSGSFQLSTTTVSFARAKSKWDDLKDEDEDVESPYETVYPIPPDMTYEPRNLVRQSQNFQAIRDVGGKDVTNDIYIRARADVSLEKAVARQWPMIERHGCNLRPVDLMPHWGKLELWAAPGDSELDVAYNKPSCEFQKMEREVEGASAVKLRSLGFQGESYENEEDGFRTWRKDDGTPARPEIMVPTTPQDASVEPIE